ISLNTEPEKASALLLKNLFAQSFGAGGKSCLPMIPKLGLSESFVEPCLTQLQQHGAEIKFGWRLRGVVTEGLQVKELDFDEDQIELGSSDWVILAVPAWVAEEMVPDLIVPHEFRSIANIHYRIEVPENPTGFTGLIGGLAEWAFVKDGVASVTISAADRHDKQKPQTLAVRVWRDLAKLYDLDPEKTPPWRVVHEKRATFAATPLQNSRRPHPYIGWKNLALAGDWTATSLPSTIEGAIRSGVKASQVVMRWSE
ncbi:MAG: hypothetical protein HGA90_05270, partial [Alphaproteobacteria bacterium]|nr:hypothetical protein [Alphaproteobacteria bacterium]